MFSTSLGAIFQLTPRSGSEGDSITVRIPPNHPAEFRTTSQHEAYFSPLQLPPGLASTTTFFGYPASFRRVDNKTATVTVPRFGTNALSDMVPGNYYLVIVTNRDYATSQDVFVATRSTSTGSSPTGPSLGGGLVFGTIPPSPFPTPGSPTLPPTPARAIGQPQPSPFISPRITIRPGLNSATGRLPLSRTPLTVPTGGSGGSPPFMSVTPGTGGSGITSTPGPVTPPSSDFPNESEAIVRWLVESLSPIREAPGPDMIVPSHDPSLYNSPIPVENENSPPMREFNVIVSSQLMLPDETPIKDERLTFRFLEATDLPGDDSAVLEVSDDLRQLRQKLKTGSTPSRSESALTDSEGKVYTWFRLRLYEDAQIADLRLKLKGFKVIVGEATEPTMPAPVAAIVTGSPVTTNPALVGGMITAPIASTAIGPVTASPGSASFLASTGSSIAFAPGPAMLAGAGRAPGIARNVSEDEDNRNFLLGFLEDVLVEPTKRAVVTIVEYTAEGLAEARAAIARTVEQVVGFALARFADGVATLYLTDFPSIETVLETARGAMLGAFLGIPRGLWVMAKDQVQDVKALVFDLPRALYNFFAEDPKFALEVLGSLLSPGLGTVIYTLDPEFRGKINGALARFKDLAATIGKLLEALWAQIKSDVSAFSAAIGGLIYDSFSDFVGNIATDYLGFRKDSPAYMGFVAGFIAGDFLGYILGTVGVQVLLAYATAGVANWVSAVAKVGKLARLVEMAAPIVRFIAALKEAFAALGTIVREFAITVKEAIGKVLLSVLRLLDKLFSEFITPLVELLVEQTERMARWLLSYGRDQDGGRLVEVAEGLKELGSDLDSQVVKDAFALMAELAEPPTLFVPACAIP